MELKVCIFAYMKIMNRNNSSGIDWLRYEADLARDIAVKAVDCAFDRRPEKVAEYAVKIARSVVEQLRGVVNDSRKEI